MVSPQPDHLLQPFDWPRPSERSSLHYALRRAKQSDRDALMSIYGLCRTLWDIPHTVSDSSVALSKLAWWRNELLATSAGQATHPLTQRLLGAAGGSASRIDTSSLLLFAQACEQQLSQGRLLDEAALLGHLEAVGVSPWKIAATLLDDTTPGEVLQALGRGLRLTDIVSRLGLDARAGCIYLPVSDLQRFGVKAGELVRPTGDLDGVDAFRQLMRHETQRVQAWLGQAGSGIAAQQTALARPARALIALALAQLSELERADFAVLNQRIVLTPLRKVWLAWRS